MLGDATLFMRADQTEAAWEILTPILEVWDTIRPTDFPNYRRAPGVRRPPKASWPRTAAVG